MRIKAVVAALVASAALAACGDDSSEDKVAVEEAAQEQADRHSAGDYAGAWDMWVKDAQESVPQDIYVAYSESCSMSGVPLEVSDVRVEEPGSATVRVGVGGLEQAYDMRFEGDEWRWVPTDETLEKLSDVETVEAASAAC